MISSGVISEIIGMLPAMKMTEPNSPMAREKASVKPVSSAGKMAGKMILTQVCSREAPSEAAASSTSGSMSSITGCSVRTMKGSVTNASATTMPLGV